MFQCRLSVFLHLYKIQILAIRFFRVKNRNKSNDHNDDSSNPGSGYIVIENILVAKRLKQQQD